MLIQSMSNKVAVVTLHDAAPSFSKRIFEFPDALENLGINFNVAVIPFLSHKEDLPRFPDYLDKVRLLNNARRQFIMKVETAHAMITSTKQKEPQRKRYAQAFGKHEPVG